MVRTVMCRSGARDLPRCLGCDGSPRWGAPPPCPGHLLGLLGDTRSAKLLPVHTPVKLLHDQSLVSLQEGVGCHEGCRLLEALAAEWVDQHRKPPAVGIGEVQPAVASELGSEDTVFRKENRDDLLLVRLERASKQVDQDVEEHRRSSG